MSLVAAGFDSPQPLVASAAFTAFTYLNAYNVDVTSQLTATQLAAIAAGRYAPYPEARERPPRGPIRELIGRLLRLALGRRPARELRRAAGS